MRRDFQARLKQRESVLEKVLAHTDPRQEEDDVGIFGCEFMGASQQIQGIDRT